MTDYELVVRGRLSARVGAAVGPFRVVERGASATVLRGPVSGPAELQEAVEDARSLGLEVIEIRSVDDRDADDASPAPAAERPGRSAPPTM